ncbi:MAG: ABC transporter permease [Hyphomicrobiales bacterium]|nr:ABC transporter permease [Hyphomicrobiales bacterium]
MTQGRARIAAFGAWTVRDLERIDSEAAAILRALKGAGAATLDLSGLTDLDTAGAWRLQKLVSEIGAARVAIQGASAEQRLLLEEVGRHAEALRSPVKPEGRWSRAVSEGVAAAFTIATDAVRLTAFLGQVTACAGRLAVRPWRFRGTAFVHHLDRSGLRAAPIVILICVLIGAVIMQQGIVQLRYFGAEALAIDLLGVLALREVAVLLTAIIVAGRSASSFTAEIGTMKMREEIDALRTLGIDPIETLVLPRILALIVALPLLTFLADMACLLGGAIMAKVYLGLDWPVFAQRLNASIELRHFFVGMVKAPFAALIIGLVGCLEGLRVEGSAESVGRHVTSAVVKAIFLVMAFDGVFAIFLSASGF